MNRWYLSEIVAREGFSIANMANSHKSALGCCGNHVRSTRFPTDARIDTEAYMGCLVCPSSGNLRRSALRDSSVASPGCAARTWLMGRRAAHIKSRTV
jgi:hypothetical protein